MERILECVPNFSEGRNKHVIDAIVQAIQSVENVYVLDVDPGVSTNRTVVTFVGEPEAVVEAAYRGIAKAAELIDMSKHKGEHPRIGATDVCPFVPISGITIEEAVVLAKQLAQRVGETLRIPVYLYEYAATSPERKNLATIRAGEYEGLPEKLKDPKWKPDYGPAEFNPKTGATVIGVRNFLVAYNINLNTTSVRRANTIAFDLREQGRVKQDPNGNIVRDEKGNPIREPGKLKYCKAIGWYIEEYGIAQVSMNLTNIDETPLHVAYEKAVESALERGLLVTGSEIVGMVPKRVLIEAGKHFLRKQNRSTGVSERELIHIAVKSLGLDSLRPFNPQEKVIEYKLEALRKKGPYLYEKSVEEFLERVASELPAPGGGSVSALLASLGAALGAMVANLTANKPIWDTSIPRFGSIAENLQSVLRTLMIAIHKDTEAFEEVMNALRSKDGDRIEAATWKAVEVPLAVMEKAMEVYPYLCQLAEEGNPNAISDVGVGTLSLTAGIQGAALNVLINLASVKDQERARDLRAKVERLLDQSEKEKEKILAIVREKLRNG